MPRGNLPGAPRKTSQLESKPRRRASLNSRGSRCVLGFPVRSDQDINPSSNASSTSEHLWLGKNTEMATIATANYNAAVQPSDGWRDCGSELHFRGQEGFFEPHVFLHFTQKTRSSLFTIISYWSHGKQLVLSDEVWWIRTRSNAQIGLSLLSFFTVASGKSIRWGFFFLSSSSSAVNEYISYHSSQTRSWGLSDRGWWQHRRLQPAPSMLCCPRLLCIRTLSKHQKRGFH